MKTLIVIAGPTASGKTTAAIELANHFNTEIISADSRQCYKELKIGVARPSSKELATVTHHFIASHSITENITAASFEKYALQKLNTIFTTNNYAIICGGTGLYIQALLHGIENIPTAPANIIAEVNEMYNTQGLQNLQNAVALEDPLFFTQKENQNPARLIRALIVIRSTGKSITLWQTGKKAIRNFTTKYFVLQPEKEILHQNINTRVNDMMANGLLQEVEKLLPFEQNKNLHTVGYTELFAFLNNKITLVKAVENIQMHTRQYAKRQTTWFKKIENTTFIQKFDLPKILETL